MSKPVLRSKLIHPSGDIEEQVIWSVPKSTENPDGIRYRLVYVRNQKVLVLYDNHHPKGHHKHIKNHELSYRYQGIEQLIIDFDKDVEEVKGHEDPGNKN